MSDIDRRSIDLWPGREAEARRLGINLLAIDHGFDFDDDGRPPPWGTEDQMPPAKPLPRPPHPELIRSPAYWDDDTPARLALAMVIGICLTSAITYAALAWWFA